MTRYWSIKPALIDNDRAERGDFFKKPTQYWFINCAPKHNFVGEPITQYKEIKRIANTSNKVERSMISPEYARRFIQEQLIDL